MVSLTRLNKGPLWMSVGSLFLLLTLLISPGNCQWLSFRNPKSDLWFPNMPASPRALQQRSSVGSSLRGIPTSSTSLTNSHVKGHEGRARTRARSAPASYQTLHGGPVHGGIISRQENTHAYPSSGRNPYQSSSRLTSSNNKSPSERHTHSSDTPKEKSYSSSARLAPTPQGHHPSKSPEGTPFAQRAGSWWSKTAPTVVTSKHLSINLNGRRPEPTTSYASSRRLLEVGRGVEATPTRRPITQTAGALQDSWPNSNAHHHMSPMLKNQKEGGQGGYYEVSHGSGSPWGSNVRVSDTPIQINAIGSKSIGEGERSYVPNGPVDRHLSVVSSRDKMVSNTLNTLAKLSPKKPIYVFMRAEGIAAIEGGADAGEVIKKLAGSSKLPFYNGTRSLPRDNKPTVFLAPEDMDPPGGYGKIPIPNLKAKEGKPTYTKILLPGGTKMNSHLSHYTTTTSTSRPFVASPSVFTTQGPFQVDPYGSRNGSMLSTDGLSIEQKLRILQMLKGQAEAAMGQGSGGGNPFQFAPTGPGGPYQNQIFNTQGSQFNSPGGVPTFQGSVAETDIQKLIGSIVETAVSQTVGQMMPGGPPTQTAPFGNGFGPSPFPNMQSKVGNGGNGFGNPTQGPPNQGPGPSPFNQGPTQRPRPPGPKRINPIKNALSLLGIQSTMSPNNRTPGPTSPRPPHMFQNHAQQRTNGPFNAPQRPTIGPFNGQQGPTNGPFNGQQGPTNGPFNGQQGPTNGPFNGQQGPTNGPFNGQQGPTNGPFNGQQGPTTGPFNVQQGSTMGPFNGKQRSGNGPFNNQNGGPPRNNYNGPQQGQNGPPQQGQNGPPQQGQNGPPQQGQNGPPTGFNRPPHGPPPIFNNGPPPNYNNAGPPSVYNTNGPPQNVQLGPSGNNPNGPTVQRLPYLNNNGPMDDPNPQGGKKPGSTIIVQTPDKSQPNGQKNTFVITNGGSDIPELRKIMKVINELNEGSPSPYPSPPSGTPQQPQVMIRHPAGSPTPGPHIIMSSTGPPNQFHLGSPSPTSGPSFFVSSTQSSFNSPRPTVRPQQIFVSSSQQPVSPTSRPIYVSSTPAIDRPMFVSSTSSPVISLDGPTPRPIFMSSTPRPNIVGNRISPSNRPIIMSSTPRPFFASSGPTLRPFVSSTRGPAILGPSQSPQLPVIKVPVQAQKPVQAVFTNPLQPSQGQTAEELMAAADGKHRIIEIDPSATPQQIQNAIMQSILKQNGGVAPKGPIVISNLPPGMSAGANGLEINQQQLSNTSDQGQGSFKIQSAIEVVPTFEPVSATPTGSREVPSSMSGESRNRLNLGSSREKSHHHSKEALEDKPRNKNRGESGDKISRREDSSEVIEKVITEEKIVWNPGPSDGEMIPSRIKTEERIILRPHGIRPTPPIRNSVEKTTSPSKEKSSEESGDRGAEGGSILQNLFGATLLNKGKLKKSEDGANPKFSLNSAAHNFAGLLRSKLKFEKMKQKLYPSTQPLNPEVEGFNPFLRYLSPSPIPAPVSANTTQDQGRFKIRPGDLSKNLPPMPSPSSFPTEAAKTTSASTFTTVGSTSASFQSSPGPTGPSSLDSNPTFQSELFTIPPGTQDERLLFIPAADPSRTPDPKPISTVPTSRTTTIQTKNDQNQTVLFTTMNNLPDLMAQLSGTKTEVRMINDMNTWQATLDKVKADKDAQAAPPTAPSLTRVTTETLQRRMDEIVDQPMTWRPNGTVPTPTLEPFRKRFPSGLGANVLHALSAGFSSNSPSAKGQWESPDRNNFIEGRPQVLYTMSNGVPIPVNPSMGSYQPILIQGTKQPVLAYYGYNWGGAPGGFISSTPTIPMDLIKPSDVDNIKYHSRFKGTDEQPLKSSSPVYKMKKQKVRTKTTTLDPLDPISEEYEASSAEEDDEIEVKNRRKGQSKPRRRRPGKLQEDDGSGSSSEELPPTVTLKKVSLQKAETEAPQVKVQKEMFVLSGEERKEGPPSKLVSEEVKPTSKLPFLLAPSIISNKSVVKKTGFSNEKTTPTVSTSTTPTTPLPKTTSQLLTTLLTKMTTTPKVAPTIATGGGKSSSPNEDDEFRETQAELKTLLKKIQEKLGGKEDLYELGDEYDYFEELPSTKATTTTTTKGTKRPKTTKKPKGTKKPKKKSKKGTKSKVKGSKGKKAGSTTKKPKVIKSSQTIVPTKLTTTTTPTTTTTSTTATPTTTPTPTTPPVAVSPPEQHQNHNRHPVSSLEALSTASSSPAARVDGFQQPFRNTIRTWLGLADKATTTPQASAEVTPPSDDPMTFVYPQSKDEAGSKVHIRRRPLWVRRKTFEGGSGESLESVGKPTSSGKVIRLVRRRKLGMRRRPVFVPQCIEDDTPPTTSTAPVTAVHYPATVEPVMPSLTSPNPAENLFQTSNNLVRRVGFSDSVERARNGTLSRSGGKRKLKLVRLKGQRAQWKLRLNNDASEDSGPQAERLIAPTAASPLNGGSESVTYQVSASSSTSVESKVCVHGKCEFISKQ